MEWSKGLRRRSLGAGLGIPCAQIGYSSVAGCNKVEVRALRLLAPQLKAHVMEESLASSSARRSIFPWMVVATVIFAAAGSVFWMNQKIEALQTVATAPRQAFNVDEMRQVVAALQQTTKEIQTSQQKLTEQVTDLQRRVAAEQGERKLLSDQLGSISGRVDALASSNADATPLAPPPQKNRRSKQ